MDQISPIERLKKGDNNVLKTYYEDHHDFCIGKLVSDNFCVKQNW